MSDSSDYVKCEVCKYTEICLICTSFNDSDFSFEDRLFLCQSKGHAICGDCTLNNIEAKRFIEGEMSDQESDALADGYLPSKFCPICQNKHPTQDMILEFTLKKLGVTKEEIILAMQSL